MEGHGVSLKWWARQTAPWTPWVGNLVTIQLDIGPADTAVPVWLQLEPGILVSHPYFHSVPPFLDDENYGDLWSERLPLCPHLAASYFNVFLKFFCSIQIPAWLLNLSFLNPRPCTISSLLSPQNLAPCTSTEGTTAVPQWKISKKLPSDDPSFFLCVRQTSGSSLGCSELGTWLNGMGSWLSHGWFVQIQFNEGVPVTEDPVLEPLQAVQQSKEGIALSPLMLSSSSCLTASRWINW